MGSLSVNTADSTIATTEIGHNAALGPLTWPLSHFIRIGTALIQHRPAATLARRKLGAVPGSLTSLTWGGGRPLFCSFPKSGRAFISKARRNSEHCDLSDFLFLASGISSLRLRPSGCKVRRVVKQFK
jgi:hypothetical protein